MRTAIRLSFLVTAGLFLAGACGDGDSAKTKVLRPDGTAGRSTGAAGKGTGGAQMGAAGGGGEAANGDEGGAGGTTGGGSGRGGSDGANGGEIGNAGDGSGGTTGGSSGTTGGTGGAGGSAGRSSGGVAGTSNGGSGGRANGGLGGSNAGSSGSSQAGTAGSGGGSPVALYVSVTGDDTATGARVDPFETLAHAAGIAQFGDTIIFLDGDYDFGSFFTVIDIPDGVDVVAENPGGVYITAEDGALMNLEGSSLIDGFEFQGFGPMLTANSETDSTVTVTNSSFFECADGLPAIAAGGNATVMLVGEYGHDWGNCGSYAVLSADAHVIVNGGELQYVTGGDVNAFVAQDASRLDFLSVVAVDGNRQFLTQYDTSQVTITSSTISTRFSSVVTMTGSSALTVDDSDLSLDPDAADRLGCIQNGMDAVGEIELYDSRFHHCAKAISGVVPAVLTLSGVEVDTMTVGGLELAGDDGGVISILDSNIHDTATYGLRLTADAGGDQVLALTVRNTTFTGSSEGVRLLGAYGSGTTWDFGTLAEPGGNTFLATTAGLAIDLGEGTFVSAVGNTWLPSQQGADGSGYYSAAPGTSLEQTTGSGPNYAIAYGAVLRLAQSGP